MTLINLDVLWSYLWRYAIIAAFFFGLGFMLGCGGEPVKKTDLTAAQVSAFWGAPRQTVVDAVGEPCFSFVDQPTGAKTPRSELMAWPAHGVIKGIFLEGVTVYQDCSTFQYGKADAFICFVDYPSVCEYDVGAEGCPVIFGCGYFPESSFNPLK